MNWKWKHGWKCGLLFLSLFCTTAWPSSQETAQRAVSLADYIAGDYQAAVAPNGGKIISPEEYAEMEEFISLIDTFFQDLKVPRSSPLYLTHSNLKTLIEKKSDVVSVRTSALALRDQIIGQFNVQTNPNALPDLAQGRRIYEQTCALCHGMTGKADTPTARQLNPPPRSFAEDEVIVFLSPFKAFNTITYGVAGTGMASFAALPEEDRWSVASYLFTLRAGLPPPTEAEAKVPWKEAANRNDEELAANLQTAGVPKDSVLQELSQIRHLRYLDTESAPEDRMSALAGLRVADEKLWKSFDAYSKGDPKEALHLAVSAYLDGFEKSEPLLLSLGQKTSVRAAEQKFIEYRTAIRTGSHQLPILAKDLSRYLLNFQRLLQKNKELSAWTVSVGAALIIFREGMEAILLLAVILSVLSSLNVSGARRWFHGSWILALVIGAVTWVVAKEIISGALREGMEGWLSLIASAVLVYVSFWLLAKKDAEHWKKYLMKKLTSKRTFGLATIGLVTFLAVYREVFETILFMEALRLQAKTQNLWLTLGALSGAVPLFLVAWLILRVGKRLPLGIFFGVSGVLLYALAVIFLGQGIHSLQEADFISQSPLPFVTIPTLGVFPYWETLAPQAALIVVFLASFGWQRWLRTSRSKILDAPTLS